jgi:hypothetical protein
MPSGRARRLCAGAVLVAGIAGCAHDGGRPVEARISGNAELSGGRYPGVHSPPQRFDVVVTDAAGAMVWSESRVTGRFTFVLSKGDYQVSVRAGAGTCGRPQDISVRSRESIALSFVCAVK